MEKNTYEMRQQIQMWKQSRTEKTHVKQCHYAEVNSPRIQRQMDLYLKKTSLM